MLWLDLVLETLIFNELTQLTAQEDFINFHMFTVQLLQLNCI
jgi:hypothetical protein